MPRWFVPWKRPKEWLDAYLTLCLSKVIAKRAGVMIILWSGAAQPFPFARLCSITIFLLLFSKSEMNEKYVWALSPWKGMESNPKQWICLQPEEKEGETAERNPAQWDSPQPRLHQWRLPNQMNVNKTSLTSTSCDSYWFSLKYGMWNNISFWMTLIKINSAGLFLFICDLGSWGWNWVKNFRFSPQIFYTKPTWMHIF